MEIFSLPISVVAVVCAEEGAQLQIWTFGFLYTKSVRGVRRRCMYPSTTTGDDLMRLLLIFFVKSVGAWPNDFSFIYRSTRLKSQASRIVTTNSLSDSVLSVWASTMKSINEQRNPGNLLGSVQSHYTRTYVVRWVGEKATSLISYKRHLFRRTIYFLPYFHSVEFFISTFRQDKFKIAFFLWASAAAPTPTHTHTHRAWGSFSFAVFVINEEENWRLEFNQRTCHSLRWDTAHRSAAK